MYRYNNSQIVMPRKVKCITDVNEIKDRISNANLIAVDTFGIKDFALSKAGWPQNSISILARAQTIEQYNMIAQYLTKRNVDNPDLSKIPIAQQFALARPRSVQLPHELDAYADTIAKIDIARIQRKYDDSMSNTEPTKPITSSTTES